MSDKRWAELRLVVPRRSAEDVGALLVELGATGTQEDWLPGQTPPPRQPWDEGPPPPLPEQQVVVAWWLAGTEDPEAVAALARERGLGEPLWRELADADWGEDWKLRFEPIHIAEGLVVAPPWAAAQGDLVIEPGLGFGTGEHVTTRACLEAIVRLARPGARCLDVGTGSGVLALAAARFGMTAWGIDVDPDAVAAARDNALRNGSQLRLDATSVADIRETFELVVANLYAEVIAALAPHLVRVTGEHLVLAGILADRAHLAEEALTALELVRRVPAGEWVSLEYRRP